MDAVSVYITAGVLEFGRNGKPYMESGASIARALGLPKNIVKTYINRLIKGGIIAREGNNGDMLRDRPWSVPALNFSVKGSRGGYRELPPG